MYLRYIFRKDITVTSYGAKKTPAERQSRGIRKSHVWSWTLNNNLKSHFRRADFFSPHLLQHLPDCTDKIILCKSLWLLCWGCKYNCKVCSAFHLKGTQGALQINRASSSSPLLNTIPAEDRNCSTAAGIAPYSQFLSTHGFISLLFPHSLEETSLMKFFKRHKW